ncbi:MAG TPA: (d)CMP kinase [Chloroflexota bacterium]|nr:(d)CMP kinase [Chloroflexota bacterium]
MDHPVIAIDGPAAVGKSTVGRRLAERLGWTFFDTGVLYRALAWLANDRGLSAQDEAGLAALARELDVRVSRPSVADGRDADIVLGDRDITWEIRKPGVDASVSIVAALPAVRVALVPAQRRAAAEGPAVVVGRDIGTVIFPEAPLKVYLDATPEERARRRAAELAARGSRERHEDVLARLRRRDSLDSGRLHAPLSVARDAWRIVTDQRTVDEVVEEVLRLWQARAAEPR